MAVHSSYLTRRGQIATYFDHTAARAWQQLTSDAPVSRVRQTVRAGRQRMQTQLRAWLPADLSGLRVLDAGCGTGLLSLQLAREGARVVAVDLSARLVDLAAERAANAGLSGIEFRVGDMLECAAAQGPFDHVVAMDSLIHYSADDMVTVAASLMAVARRSLLFSFAPRTPALAAMHAVGRLIPAREHRAPAIVPVAEAGLRRALQAAGLQTGRTRRVSSGFYTSQALEVVGG